MKSTTDKNTKYEEYSEELAMFNDPPEGHPVTRYWKKYILILATAFIILIFYIKFFD